MKDGHAYKVGMVIPEGNIRFETAPDGTVLRIGHWPARPPAAAARCAILCQGRTEFLEKYHETIHDLQTRGYDVWSMDLRGQGLSDREPARSQKGHIRDFSAYIADLAWFAALIDQSGPAETVLIGHSMGGHIALRAVLEGRIAPGRVVLTAPMVDLPLRGVSRIAIETLCRLACLAGFGERYVTGLGDYAPARVRFDGNPLTGDATRFAAIHTAIAANPGVEMGGPTFGWLNATFASIARLRKLCASDRPACPILICTATADRVVSVAAQDDVCNVLPACTQLRIEGARHEILHETNEIRRRFWAAFDSFTEPS